VQQERDAGALRRFDRRCHSARLSASSASE
jgi:hypothetical protein